MANALGVASDVGNQYIQKQSETQARQGVADATLGKVDDEKVRKGLAYRDGVEQIQAKQAIFDARAAWQAHYAEKVDKTLPTDEVARQYDAFMKEQLGPVLQSNPRMVAKMSGEYMRGIQETIVGHQAQLTAQHVQLATNVMQQEIVDDIDAGQPEKFFEHVQEHVALTGDMDKSIATGIEIVGIEAVKRGRPDLLDAIPTMLTGDDGKQTDNPDFNADHRANIERYKEAANAARLKNMSVQMTLQKSETEKTWIDSLNANTPIPWGSLMYELQRKDPVFSQDEVMAYYRQNLAMENALKDSIEFSGLDPSTPFYMQQGKLDAAGKAITKERIQNQVNRLVEASLQVIRANYPDLPPELAMSQAAIKISATQAYPYEPLKATFENVPLDDTQTFANVAAAYQNLPETQRAKYVSDPKRRADFEWFLQRRDAIGAKAAVEEIATRDPEMAEKTRQQYRKEINETADKIGGELLQGSSWNPFGEDDVTVNDLIDANYAKRVISENTELRLTRGTASVESARKAAIKDFTNTHMIIPTKGGYRSIPRVAGVTEQFGLAIDWAEKNMAVTAKSLGITRPLPEGTRLVFDPMRRDNSAMIVVDADGMPMYPGVLRFGAAQLEALYRKQNPDGTWKKAQEDSARQQRLHQRLDEWPEYQKTHPTLPFSRDHN